MWNIQPFGDVSNEMERERIFSLSELFSAAQPAAWAVDYDKFTVLMLERRLPTMISIVSN